MQANDPKFRTISSNDAKERLNELIDDITGGGDEVILESGEKKVAVIPYEEFVDYRQRKGRDDALRRLREMETRAADRNADFTDENVEELANRAGQEIRDELNRKYRAGLLSFPDAEPE